MYVCLHLCVFRDEWIDGYEDIQVQSKGYIYTIQRLDIYTIQMFCYQDLCLFHVHVTHLLCHDFVHENVGFHYW